MYNQGNTLHNTPLHSNGNPFVAEATRLSKEHLSMFKFGHAIHFIKDTQKNGMEWWGRGDAQRLTEHITNNVMVF